MHSWSFTGPKNTANRHTGRDEVEIWYPVTLRIILDSGQSLCAFRNDEIGASDSISELFEKFRSLLFFLLNREAS